MPRRFTTPRDQLTRSRLQLDNTGDIVPFNPLQLPNLLYLLDFTKVVPANPLVITTGSRNISGTAPNMTVACPGATAVQAGGTVRLSGYTTPGNNGTFTITAAGTDSLSYQNPSGVAQAAVTASRVETLGVCETITDLKNGIIFGQDNAARRWACNDSFVINRKFIASGGDQTLRFLLTPQIPSILAPLNGLAPLTLATYFHPITVGISSGVTAWAQITENFSGLMTTVSRTFPRFTTLTAAAHVATRGITGGTASAYTSPAFTVALNAWHLLVYTFDGTNHQWWVDAVAQGAPVTGTARSLSNQQYVLISNGGQGDSSNGASRMYRGIDLGMAGVMSQKQQAQLYNYCQQFIAA